MDLQGPPHGLLLKALDASERPKPEKLDLSDLKEALTAKYEASNPNKPISESKEEPEMSADDKNQRARKAL